MFKTIMTIIVTILVVLFSIENFEHVPVSFIAGKPVNMRLIFVITVSGVIGYLIRHFSAIATEDRLKRQLQHLLKKKNSVKKGPRRVGNNRKEMLLDDEFEDEEEL
ncbi:MAG: hypothetical protein HQK69_10315 [Desulfamplus sp.]|nr:hypothetical protein [Desulfamplus sp.]